MVTFLMIILWVDSLLIIGAVLMQPTKNNDAMSSLSGGGNEGSTETKARGFEAFMQKATVILGVVFFVDALILMWISSH